MATPIRIKRSAVSGKKPQNIDLQVGELALNTYDGSLFTKRDTGGVGIATTVSNITPWVENFGGTSINYSSGNVGIGSDIPTSKLDINGSLNVSAGATFAGDITANGNIVGDDSTNISGISSVTATNLYGALTGNVQGNLTGTVLTGAQPNITSLGTLGSLNVTNKITANDFESTVSTGTAPFVVASTTKVTNLNADLLDGKSTANSNVGNSIVIRNAAGGFIAGDVNFQSIVGTALSVSGISTFNSGVGIADSIFNIEHPNTAIRFLTEEVAIETAGTERLRITSSGEVGIGTISPASMFHIHSGVPRITMSDSGTGVHHKINADSSVGNFAFDVDYDSITSTPAFIVNIKDGEKLRITSTGKVGIGTANPTAHLQVYRATQFASNPIIQARSNNGSTNELKFEIDGDGDAYFNGKVGIGTLVPSHELTLFGDDPIIEILEKSVSSKVTIGTGTVQGFINIQKADGTRTVQISSDGNSYFKGGKVGIGTNDPSAIFDVTDGTTRISFNRTNNTPRIDFKSNNVADLCQIKASESVGGGVLQVFTKTTGGTSTERVRILSDGKVKICHVDGENPTEPLHVVATAVNQDIARFTGANRDRGLVISTGISGITNDAVIKYNADSQNSAGQHVFLTDGIERLRIDSSGNLKVTGIATFDQNVSIGGTLTYEDVTNIDSVGIITARSGIKVTAGGINAVGVVTATQADIGTGGLDVDGTTDLDTLNVSEVSTFSDKIVVDTSNVSEFKGNGRIKISGATQTTKLHLQRGSTSDVAMRFENNHGSIYAGLAAGFNNNQRFIIGLDADLSDDPILIANETKHVIVGSSTTGATFSGATGDAKITGILTATSFSGSGASLTGLTGASANTYGNSNNTPVITVDGNGRITTITTASISGGGGNVAGIDTTGTSVFNTLDIGGDIDVDGHTELDNLNVTGVSTFNQLATFSNGINIPTNKTIGLGDTTSATIEYNSSGVMNRLNKHGADDFTWKLEDQAGTMHMEVRSGTTNSYVQLRQNGNIKFETKDYGVEITGTTDTDQLNVSGVSTLGGKVRINNTDLTTSSSADELIIGDTSGNRGLTIFSGTSNTGNIFFADTSTTGVGNRMGTITYDHSDNYMRFSTSGNQEKLRIVSDGKVGIGLTNPDGQLHISSGTSGDCRVYIEADADNNAEGDNPFIIFKNDGGIENASVWCGNTDGGTNDNSLNLSASTSVNGGIRFFTGDTDGDWETADERVRITPDGELLINAVTERSYVDGAGFTQTPKLQVESNSNVDTAISLRYNSGGGAVGRRASFIFARTADGSAVSNNSVLGEVLFMGEGNSTLEKAASIRAEVDETPGTNDMPGRLIFSTSADGSDSPTERLRIDKDGKVGIGTDLTTTPSSTLTVAPHNSASGRNISIYTSGAVGNKAGLFFNSTSGTGNLAEIQAEYKGTNEGELVLSTSMQKRLTINKDGNVGIGTDAPGAARLKVVHDGLDQVIQQWGGAQGPTAGQRFMELYSPATDNANDYFRFQTGNAFKFRIDNTDALAMNSSGNVGIGTDSPQSRLYVLGDARITGILTVGQSSLTLDGDNNIVNVGTALTLGHTQGVQFHTQNLHASGFEVNQINATGIITANTFKGALTGNVTGTATLASGLTGTPSITVQDITAEMVSIGGTLTYEDVTNIDSIGIITARDNIKLTAAEGQIEATGSTGLTLNASDGSAFARIRVAGDTRLHITSDGNVGIGTATAPHLLSVKGTISKISSTSGIQLVNIANDASQNGTIAINQSGGTERIKLHSSGASYFNGGNVGIGSAVPSQKLDVAGNIKATGQVRVSDGTTAEPSVAAASDTNSGLYFPGADAVGLVAGGSRKLLANSSGVTINNGDLAVNGGNLDVSEDIRHIDNTNTKISFTSNTISFDTAGDERLRITSGGKIEVKGTRAGSLQASDDDTLQLYTASTNNNIDRGAGITFYNHDNSGYEMGGTIQVAKENGTADDVAAYMRFSTRPAGGSATERLRIDSDGKLLIGINASTSGDGQLQSFKPTGNNSTVVVGNVATAADGLTRVDFCPSNSTVGARIECHATEDFSTVAKRTADLVFVTRKDGTHSEKLRINSDGRLLLNDISSRVVANITAQLQLEGTTANTSAISITRNSDNASPPYLSFGKSRATSTGGTTIIQDDDNLGEIRFSGTDGNDLTNHAASINVEVDGTPSNNVTPGRLIFSTASGSDATERLRITSTGLLQGTSGQHDGGLELLSGNNNQSTRLRIQSKSSGGTAYNWYLDSARSADRFTIHDGSTSWFTILGTGYVGINETSPIYALSIGINTGTAWDSTKNISNTTNNDFIGLNLTNSNSAANAEVGILFQSTTSGAGQYSINCRKSAGSQADLIFRTRDGGAASKETLRIASDGQTTVSSTSNQPLVLNNTNANGQSSISFQSAGSTKYNLGSNKDGDGNIDFFIYDQINSAHRFNIKADGNIGIGTDNPTNKLEVYGTDAAVTLLNYGQSSGGLAAWPSGRLAFVSAHQNDDLVFGYSNSTLQVENFVEAMRIDNGTGKVGIGTINPDELLHLFSASSDSKIVLEAGNNSAVNGIFWNDENSNTQSEFYYSHPDNKQFLKFNGNGLEIYSNQTSSTIAKVGHGIGYNEVVIPNGKVGVGTDDPKTDLDVRGSISMLDSLVAPHGGTVTYAVTVAAKVNHRYPAGSQSSSNAFYIDGIESPVLTLTPGRTYRFTHDNTGSHPLKFYHQADKTTLYTSGVDFQNTYTEITVTKTTPSVLYYQCTAHDRMGNAVITNSEGLYHVGVSTFTSVIHANNGIKLTSSDNKSIILGEHEDMRMRHTGSHSEITDEGTGSLRLGGDQIVIGNAAFDETNAVIKQGATGYVVLKQNGNTKLTTTNTGVVVTGILTATSFKDANGNTIGGGGGGVTVQDEGSALSTTGTTLNFVGNGVVASGTGATKTITISGGGSGVTVGNQGSDLSTLGTTLNFVGSGVVASGTGATKTITISGGGGGTGGKFVENATGIHTLGNVGLGTTNASEAILNISTGAGVTDTVALDIQGTEGSLFSVTNNLTSGSLFSINDVSGIPAFDYNANGKISMGAFADTVAIGKTSSGVKLGVKGSITEGVHIVANKLSAAPNINVDNGNVHLFTTNETTTATPNVTSTVGLNTSMDTGDTLTVVIISKPNNAGYYAELTIDGVAQTEEWLGGSAPSSASSDGYDVNTYNVIKTGDAAYIVLANSVNFSN